MALLSFSFSLFLRKISILIAEEFYNSRPQNEIMFVRKIFWQLLQLSFLLTLTHECECEYEP